MARTLSMWLVATANALVAAALIIALVVFVLPNLDQPEPASYLPALTAFIAVAVLAGLAAAGWSGAPRRAWIWLVAALPPILVTLMYLPLLSYDLTHPQTGVGFVVAVLTVAAGIAAIVGGLTAFRQARARETGAASPRAKVTVATVGGILAGSIVTSLVASGAAGGSGAVEGTPTTTLVVAAAETKFAPTELSIGAAETLGLFVVNEDTFAHSFDIDELGIHVQLPANSTTAVVVKPTGPGRLRYYCAIPGHVEAGMVGTLVVQ